jgi:hypothetical protein
MPTQAANRTGAPTTLDNLTVGSMSTSLSPVHTTDFYYDDLKKKKVIENFGGAISVMSSNTVQGYRGSLDIFLILDGKRLLDPFAFTRDDMKLVSVIMFAPMSYGTMLNSVLERPRSRFTLTVNPVSVAIYTVAASKGKTRLESLRPTYSRGRFVIERR